MYLEKRIKVIYYRKQVIQCRQFSFATKTPRVDYNQMLYL